MPRLLADYAVPAGAGLVDLQVEMLELGAISVHGATVIELTQETFQCFFRCLGDTVPPDVSDELRRQLNGDRPPELDDVLLRAAGAPLPAGLYDVIDAAAPVTDVRHTGICVNCPSDYRAGAGADAWGVELREAGTQVRIGYGRDVPQPTATPLYRASLGEFGLVLLPLTGLLEADRDLVRELAPLEWQTGNHRTGVLDEVRAVWGRLIHITRCGRLGAAIGVLVIEDDPHLSPTFVSASVRPVMPDMIRGDAATYIARRILPVGT